MIDTRVIRATWSPCASHLASRGSPYYTYSMKRNSTIYVLALFVLLIVFLSACGAPYVGESSIDGVIQKVKNWQVEYQRDPHQEEAYQRQLKANIEQGTRYNSEDSAREFVDQVRELLRGEYGLTIASNFPSHGTIVIRLYGSATSQFMPMDTNIVPRHVREEISLDPMNDPEHNFSAVSPGEPLESRLRRDRVTKAHVIIYDELGNIAGEVFVGRKTEDNVKPDFLAKVIAKVITEGRY